MRGEILNQHCNSVFANPWRVLLLEGYLTLLGIFKLILQLLITLNHVKSKAFKQMLWAFKFLLKYCWQRIERCVPKIASLHIFNMRMLKCLMLYNQDIKIFTIYVLQFELE